MQSGEQLAYLGGIVDGDGYLKITRNCRESSLNRAYHSIMVGIQQMRPSEAVVLFANTFGGRVKSYPTLDQRLMARSEVRGRRAETTVRRLLPYLLIKRKQAFVVLEAARVKFHESKIPRTTGIEEELGAFRRDLIALHEGRPIPTNGPNSLPAMALGLEDMTPEALGWTVGQTFAYLAGIMDSDGSFRVETRRVPEMRSGLHYRISIRRAQVAPSPAVKLLAKTFGGSLSIKKSKHPNLRHLDFWSLHDRSAVPAIESLLPHLRVKWREAVLLLELRRLKERRKDGLTEWVHPNRWHTAVTMRKRCYTPEQVSEFERIHRAVQALHSGETAATTGTPGGADPDSTSVDPPELVGSAQDVEVNP